jgi:hypothetical protein
VEKRRCGSFPGLVLFRLVAPPLQYGVVGLFPGMGSMVLQPFATGGNRLYPEFLGRNWHPTVPEVNYPDRGHQLVVTNAHQYHLPT